MEDGQNGARAGMKALILSAGQGSRLLPLTESRPKCLIELSGRSLLEWQLLALSRAGIDEVVIVTGFAAEQVEAMLALHTPSGMRVRTVFNPFYNVSDNLATCWLVREELRGGGMILNGDTLIEPEIARRVLARSEEHTSELQSLMRSSYAVFCLQNKKHKDNT